MERLPSARRRVNLWQPFKRTLAVPSILSRAHDRSLSPCPLPKRDENDASSLAHACHTYNPVWSLERDARTPSPLLDLLLSSLPSVQQVSGLCIYTPQTYSACHALPCLSSLPC